jgi:hypothetical protein
VPNRPLRWACAALSTLAILVATLHSGGGALHQHWSLTITDGDDALAGLIQNLLLFIPFGMSFVLAGVNPLVVIALGTALSFSVEFAQQYIPGRDPSLGDIICNANSTAIGAALVVFGGPWLWAEPRRAARQALATAILAVLVWLGTGMVFEPILSAPPYSAVYTPDWDYWGHYRGRVLASTFRGPPEMHLEASVVAPNRPPGRDAPIVVMIDTTPTKVLLLGADGRTLTLLYDTRALPLTFEHPELRWRQALDGLAPNDTFTVQSWRETSGRTSCLAVNAQQRCGLGYTIGDGWKLIFFPETFPIWLLMLINMAWLGGWTIGIGWWIGRSETSRLGYVSVALIFAGLIVVPMVTGLKPTPVSEWLGALLGLGAGFLATRRTPRVPPLQNGEGARG